MKKLGKVFIVIFALLAIVAVFIIYQPKYSTQGIEPDYQVKIGQFHKAFVENETQASKKYVGKVVEITGVIVEVSKDLTGSTVILLSKSKQGDPQVMCTLDPKYDKSSQDQLTQGSKVSLKGQCTGMLMEVVLKNGILLD